MKEKIIAILFVLFLTIFLFSSIVIKDKEISNSERRTLASFPKLDFRDVMSTKYMSDLDKYFLDQFPLRETFKSLDTSIKLSVLNKSDSEDVYLHNGYIVKQEYPLNQKMLDNYINKINSICDNYLSSNNKTYHVVIPDKNYYVNDGIHLKMDYNYLFRTIKEKISCNKHIDIYDDLTLNDFYVSDIHWKQENLFGIRNKILNNMGVEEKDDINDYTKSTYYPFYGSYYGNLSLNSIKPDTLTYLRNDVIDNCYVENIEKNKESSVYNKEELTKIDSYSVFLEGPCALVNVYNNNCDNKKELVIFRDSFASSIAPLFISSYSKITLIDLRYINMENVKKYVKFDNQDVLFMFCTTVINSSNILK